MRLHLWFLAGCLVSCTRTPEWARTPQSAALESSFSAVAVDASGNVYAAGSLWGVGQLNFGDHVTASSPVNGYSALLLKYSSTGTTLWAKTVPTQANHGASFAAVAIDSAGDVYAAGYTNGEMPGNSNNYYNAALIKYAASGEPQWTQTVVSGPDVSSFEALAIDSAGNIYAAGSIGNAGTYDFGNQVTVTSTATPYSQLESAANTVLVKYSPTGMAQWAETVVAGVGPSGLSSVAVDAAGDVYVGGSLAGAQTYDFGGGVTVTSSYMGGPIAQQEQGLGLLIKYNATGTAQWAKTVGANGGSNFNSLAIDAKGSIYATGYMNGYDAFDFGKGVSAKGTPPPGAFYGTAAPEFFMLVKYDASGNAVWANSVATVASSGDNTVAVDAQGNVVVAANQIVQYSAAGKWQWSSATTGTGDMELGAVAEGPGNHLVAAGILSGTVNFGHGVSATGDSQGAGSGWSGLVVKY